MPKVQTPIFKRPAVWTFLSATVAFFSVYALEGKVDPELGFTLIKSLLALLGLSSLAKMGYDKYVESKSTESQSN